jgi:hypothetical protein
MGSTTKQLRQQLAEVSDNDFSLIDQHIMQRANMTRFCVTIQVGMTLQRLCI